MHILAVGFILHLIVLEGINLVFYQSPLSHVNESYSNGFEPPAKRVVVFIIDNLSAYVVAKNISFETNATKQLKDEIEIPFLRSTLTTNGTWTIAQMEPPTESRIGHAGLLAGIREDPSGIFVLFHYYPKFFDSVFTYARHTWGWGHHKVIEYFLGGPNDKDNIDFFELKYDTELDLQSPYDAMHLDTISFMSALKFFNYKHKNDSCIFKDKLIFYFSFPGMDHIAENSGIRSNLYVNKSLPMIDHQVQLLSEKINDFFGNDNDTTFILSADHGNSLNGNHGSDSIYETNVPIFAWGAGITKNANQTKIINNVDVTVLISTLLGIEIPRQSLGVLPVDFLDLPQSKKVFALYTNAKQLLALFLAKQCRKKSDFFYKPFKPLVTKNVDKTFHLIDEMICCNNFTLAEELIRYLIANIFNGFDYMDQYNKATVFGLVIISFYFWISILLEAIFRRSKSTIVSVRNDFFDLLEKCCTFAARALYVIQYVTMALTIYIFVFVYDEVNVFVIFWLLPQVLFAGLLLRHKSWNQIINAWASQLTWQNFFADLLQIALILVGLEALIMGIFFYIQPSVPIIFFTLWEVGIAYQSGKSRNNIIQWILSATAILSLAFLPPISQKKSVKFMNAISNVVWLGVAPYFIYRENQKRNKSTVLLQCQMLFITFACISSTLLHFSRTIQMIQTSLQCVAAIVTVCSVVSPFFGAVQHRKRIVHVFLALAVPTIFMSTSHEPLLFLAVFVNMQAWIDIELEKYCRKFDPNSRNPRNSKQSPPILKVDNSELASTDDEKLVGSESRNASLKDLQQVLFIIYFVLISIFAIFTLISIRAYDSDICALLCIVNDKVTLSIKLAIAVLLPFVLCRSIIQGTRLSEKKAVLITLIYITIFSTHFMFLVREKGTWLQLVTALFPILISTASIILTPIFYLLMSRYATTDWTFDGTSIDIENVRRAVLKRTTVNKDEQDLKIAC